MKLGDIYKEKTSNNLIQIDCFATHMNRLFEKSIVIFRNIDGYGVSCSSFNGYGTQEEIEKEYELLIPEKDLQNYENWEEIINKFCK